MDGVWLDLHALGCFLHLAQQGTAGRAADALGMEAAMLVESVRQLEDDLNLDLVRWNQVPLVLTAAGEQLLRHGRELMRDIDLWSATVAWLRHADRCP